MTVLSIQVVIPAFNARPVIAPTLRALLSQQLPVHVRLDITVVDDGSADGTADFVRAEFAGRVNVLSLPRNSGRGNAINAGAQAGTADYMVILDADCVPSDAQAMARFVREFHAGAVVVAGQASAKGNDFWGRYIRDNNVRRARLNGIWQMTTPFCGIRRDLFLAVGGFLPDYRHYGFEDRDLLLRIRMQAGADALMRVVPDIVAWHEDGMSAVVVMRKMQEAARYTAPVFRHEHPADYTRTHLARIDSETAAALPRLGLLALLPFLPLLRRGLDPALQCAWLPYTVKARLLRLGSALAYFKGSRQR